MVVLNAKEVVGVIFSSRCIFGAPMRVQELAIIIFVRVLAGTQEEHVLTKMSQSVKPLWVLKTAHVNVERGCRLLSYRILDQETAE